MAVAKKTIPPKAKKKVTKKRTSRKIHGVEHDFVIITGGGFLVILLVGVLFLH